MEFSDVSSDGDSETSFEERGEVKIQMFRHTLLLLTLILSMTTGKLYRVKGFSQRSWAFGVS